MLLELLSHLKQIMHLNAGLFIKPTANIIFRHDKHTKQCQYIKCLLSQTGSTALYNVLYFQPKTIDMLHISPLID